MTNKTEQKEATEGGRSKRFADFQRRLRSLPEHKTYFDDRPLSPLPSLGISNPSVSREHRKADCISSSSSSCSSSSSE